MLFLSEWVYDETIGDLSDDRIKTALYNWRRSFVPSLNSSHSGDCTTSPWTCIRCLTEHYYKRAEEILKLKGE